MSFSLYVPIGRGFRCVPPGHVSIAKTGYFTIGVADLADVLKDAASDAIVVLVDPATKRLALRAAQKADGPKAAVPFKLNKTGTSRRAQLKGALHRLALKEWPARVEIQRKDDLLILQF